MDHLLQEPEQKADVRVSTNDERWVDVCRHLIHAIVPQSGVITEVGLLELFHRVYWEGLWVPGTAMGEFASNKHARVDLSAARRTSLLKHGSSADVGIVLLFVDPNKEDMKHQVGTKARKRSRVPSAELQCSAAVVSVACEGRTVPDDCVHQLTDVRAA